MSVTNPLLKGNKEALLKCRVTDQLEKRIQKAVNENYPKLKDKSDLIRRAIIMFLKWLDENESYIIDLTRMSDDYLIDLTKKNTTGYKIDLTKLFKRTG